MIVISHRAGCVKIEGHAGYAPPGQDIVCASISTITQVFIASVEELTNDKLKCNIRPGNTVIEHGDLGEKAQVLLDSFLLGIKMIAESYPDHVRVNTEVKYE